jgi:hypothetical protein
MTTPAVPESLKRVPALLEDLFTKVRAIDSDSSLLILFGAHPYLPVLHPLYIYCPEYSRKTYETGAKWTDLKCLLTVPKRFGTIGHAAACFEHNANKFTPNPVDKPKLGTHYFNADDVIQEPTGAVSLHDLLFDQRAHISLPIFSVDNWRKQEFRGLLVLGSKSAGAWSEDERIGSLCQLYFNDSIPRYHENCARAIQRFKHHEYIGMYKRVQELVKDRPAESFERLLFDVQSMREEPSRGQAAYRPYWNLGITGLSEDPMTEVCYPDRMPDLPPATEHLLLDATVVRDPRLETAFGAAPKAFENYADYRYYADLVEMVGHLRTANPLLLDVVGQCLKVLGHESAKNHYKEIKSKYEDAEPESQVSFVSYVLTGCCQTVDKDKDYQDFLARTDYPLQRFILNHALSQNWHENSPVAKWGIESVAVTLTGNFVLATVDGVKYKLQIKQLKYSPAEVSIQNKCHHLCSCLREADGKTARTRVWFDPRKQGDPVPEPGNILKDTCIHCFYNRYLHHAKGQNWNQFRERVLNSDPDGALRYFPLDLYSAYPVSNAVSPLRPGEIDNEAFGKVLDILVRLHAARHASRRQLVANAITSIIVESFGHNVAAHAIEAVAQRLASAGSTGSQKPLRSGAIGNFLRYLGEKADFWISPSRPRGEGATVTNWYQFLVEPIRQYELFWATVSGRPGLKSVSFFLECADEHGPTGLVPLLTIDVEPEVKLSLKRSWKSLEKLLVAHPGKTSGRQAFLTILENVIRNAKHCDVGETLNVCIRILRERGPNGVGHPWWNIEMYLGHNPHDPAKTKKQASELPSSIIDPMNGAPVHGGRSQGKVCAAFLFCFGYAPVENRVLGIDSSKGFEQLYPWMTTTFEPRDIGSGENKDVFVTRFRVWEGSWNANTGGRVPGNETDPSVGMHEQLLPSSNGLICRNDQDLGVPVVIDQAQRYGLHLVNSPKEEMQLHRMGIVRCVQVSDALQTKLKPSDAFFLWLTKWFSSNATESRRILRFLSDGVKFIANNDLTIEVAGTDEVFEPNLQTLYPVHDNLGHGGIPINYRSHGLPARTYFQTSSGASALEKLCEDPLVRLRLLEWLHTSIFIVDNRLNNFLNSRRPTDNRRWWDELRVCICSEDIPKDDFTNMHRTKGVDAFHFVVVHLTYLEEVKDEGESWERFLSKLRTDTGEYPFRFLAVTTGRGRTEWFDELDRHLEGRLLFLPPEALTSAIAHGVQAGDDLEIKLALATTLFGS